MNNEVNKPPYIVTVWGKQLGLGLTPFTVLEENYPMYGGIARITAIYEEDGTITVTARFHKGQDPKLKLPVYECWTFPWQEAGLIEGKIWLDTHGKSSPLE